MIAEHPRCFGRGETVYDPWHYVPGAGARGSPAPFVTARHSGLGVARGDGEDPPQAPGFRRR